MRFSIAFSFVMLISLSSVVSVIASDSGGCCRKRIYCYECDSRFDPRCGDSFNLTRDTGLIVPCYDYCVKLKHLFDNQFHYLRTCADTLKEVYIKKTEVCYSTRAQEKGSLCFCEQDLCNAAARLSRIFDDNLKQIVFVFVLFYYKFLSRNYF